MRKTIENTAAPSRITNTIEVTVAVLIVASRSIAKLKRRLATARMAAPATPTDADSVGVAMPARIDPSTVTISSSGGNSAVSTSRPSAARSASVTTIAGHDFGSKIVFQRV